METISSNVKNLMDENKDLRFEIDQQMNIIESQKQDLHNAHRTIDCLNSMKTDMEIEIEALTGLHQINVNLESKVKNLEAELSSIRLKYTDLEAELQDEKTKQEQIISKFTNEINNLKNQSNNSEEEEKNQFLSQLNDLNEINTKLLESQRILQEENKDLSDKTIILTMSLNEKDKELQEMKNLLETKTNDLRSALKLVEELQEEKVKLNTEVMSLKCHPVNANSKRGNSLFAEVEDKRVSVTQKLEQMTNKYKELKKSFIKKNAELKAIEAENIELRKQWKEDQNTPYQSVASLIEGYKTRIQELSNTISILGKRPESPQIVSISEVTDSIVGCIRSMVEDERKINRELRNEMEQKSFHQLALNEQIYELRKTVISLKSKAKNDEATIAELKQKLENKSSSDMSEIA